MSVATEEVRRQGTSIWNDPRVRSLLTQALLVIVLAWFAYEIVNNTLTNLQQRRIASGFGFLGTTAGFSIIQTLIPYSEVSSYGRAFVVGLLNTLLVASLGIVAATILGFIIGIMRLSRNWVLSRIATVYVEIVRNIPLLLQIFIWYHAVLKALPQPRESVRVGETVFLNNRGLYLPDPVFADEMRWVAIVFFLGIAASFVIAHYARVRQMRTGEQIPVGLASLGLVVVLPTLFFLFIGDPMSFTYPELQGFNFQGGLTIIPELAAMLLALSIYTASFIAEIVRAGIQAVSKGQTEAAHALGLRSGLTLRLIVVPQALRVIIPPLANQYLNLTKNSSLAVAIAYPDLVAMGGTILNQTGQAVEIIGMWMAVYLSLSLITSALMNWYNARIALVER